jgi:poly-gamma-glutamate capsule biosynthesis protein CapA/YwtB (metallophosphatase superfamily)
VKKKILLTASALILIFVSAVYCFYSSKIPFAAFTDYDSPKVDFYFKDRVYTPYRYFTIKLFHPEVKLIPDDQIDQKIASGNVLLLPWWQADKKYKPLKINKGYFYEHRKHTLSFRIIGKDFPEYDRDDFTEIAAGGTVVLARGIGKSIDKTANPYLPWQGTRELMSKADLALVNFKSPLVYDYSKPVSKWTLRGKYLYAAGLAFAGIDLASLSGNHMGDADKKGLMQTVQILKDAGVAQAGAGRDIEQAYSPYIYELDGTKIGFLAFNSVVGSISKALERTVTSNESIGIAWLDEDAIKAVEQCSKNVDLLIVLTNWGEEYKSKPNRDQVYWARRLSEAGADIIIGDQAHWVQNYEFYKDTFVAYGLGNYIFDQYWSEKTKEGIIQKYILYHKELISIETIPIKLYWHSDVRIVKDEKTYFSIMEQYYGR